MIRGERKVRGGNIQKRGQRMRDESKNEGRRDEKENMRTERLRERKEEMRKGGEGQDKERRRGEK